tara:strand:+ start:121 stop:597 length:477 start_codon:yes stop_codon:yes gene_type:complete
MKFQLLLKFFFIFLTVTGCESYVVEYNNPIRCDKLTSVEGIVVLKQMTEQKYTGSCIIYNDYKNLDGKIELKSFTKGIPNGLHMGYHLSNGEVSYKGYRKKGEIHGEYEAYHDNGNLSMKGKFRNGYYSGDWEYYDKNGKLIEIKTFFQGIESKSEKY